MRTKLRQEVVLGTKGYESCALLGGPSEFRFDVVNRDFLHLLPPGPARVLDVGSGLGQNAACLAERGYDVVAVEPLEAFLRASQTNYPDSEVLWVHDHLPSLSKLLLSEGRGFDFVLVDGVWHHLAPMERRSALARLYGLTRAGGHCAISLRNGPPGLGTHVFPTKISETEEQAHGLGFELVLRIEDQPSLLPDRPRVLWSRVAFQKPKG
ncbi:MAG: methyltransferase domain-containing protein [Myxococcota bacterium]